MTSRRLVLDAGPIIGFFYRADAYHEVAVRGFAHLRELNTQLIMPLPIVCEVYKWLLYNHGSGLARRALGVMRPLLTVLDITQNDLHDFMQPLDALPNWQGTLGDACVALTARHLGCAVWTINDRDFAAFSDIELWNSS